MGLKIRVTKPQLERRVAAALGQIDSDVTLRGVEFLDVFSCEWKKGDVSFLDGVVVGIEPGLRAKRVVEGRGKFLVPGFVDAHLHVESSLLLPHHFESCVLPKGTTTAVCDPHELTNVIGTRAIDFFLTAASSLNMDLRVMLSSCVPATALETNGGGNVRATDLIPYVKHPQVLGLAEMMNVPGVLNGDAEVLEKLEAFSDGVIDGHCPLLTGLELSAYAAAGISNCHESTRLEEAREKLTKGIAVWIREGSVAKDLKALAPLLTAKTSPALGFCTDDRNPLDILEEGHLDFVVRRAIAEGVSPEVAFRAASWSVARHYGLKGKGAIAPGYAADLVLLDDKQTCAVSEVWREGRAVSEMDFTAPSPGTPVNTIRASVPGVEDLKGPSGRVHVIEVRGGSILTGRSVLDAKSPGVAHLTVLERYGGGLPPANAYVHGFGNAFTGAIASSVGHDSHNLIVVGKDLADMRLALATLIDAGGGFCVVKKGTVLAKLELPVGGLMSLAPSQEVVKGLRALREASRVVGCELAEPFLQLAFLSLPVIPSLKLTDRGLVDVESFKIISVSAA